MADVLFYLSYAIFEVFDFLRHDSTFSNSSIDLFKFEIFISKKLISLGLNHGYASYLKILVLHGLNLVE